MDEVMECLNEIKALLICKNDSFLTEEQAAAILQVTPRYLKQLRLDGQITSIPIGGGETRPGMVRYTRDDLDSFARRHRK